MCVSYILLSEIPAQNSLLNELNSAPEQTPPIHPVAARATCLVNDRYNNLRELAYSLEFGLEANKTKKKKKKRERKKKRKKELFVTIINKLDTKYKRHTVRKGTYMGEGGRIWIVQLPARTAIRLERDDFSKLLPVLEKQNGARPGLIAN